MASASTCCRVGAENERAAQGDRHQAVDVRAGPRAAVLSREEVIDSLDTDVLILGAGGAGLTAALHATDASPALRVTVVVKGLLGRAGCTRTPSAGC